MARTRTVSARAAMCALAMTVLAVPAMDGQGRAAASNAAAEPAATGDRLDAAALRAGEFVWRPERTAEGPVEIVIGLHEQRAFAFRGGTLIGVSTISSGKPGHESPVGPFRILEKKKVHRSNRYDDAPMPFMQRLNWWGVALHAGQVPDRPASHGCIRLPRGFAQRLFEATELGGYVFMTDSPLESPSAALRFARAHAEMPLPPDRSPRGAAANAP